MPRRADLLERVFVTERARFAEFYPQLVGVTLHITAAPCGHQHCAYRDFAWCQPETGEMWFTERAFDLPLENIIGLVRHELGHLADPGNLFWMTSEQDADDVAERVSGEPIRYDQDDLQTVGPGNYPRPRHLHR